MKDILLEITKEAPDVLNDPPPAVFFMEFADFSLKKKLVVTDYLNCRINERFEEENNLYEGWQMKGEVKSRKPLSIPIISSF